MALLNLILSHGPRREDTTVTKEPQGCSSQISISCTSEGCAPRCSWPSGAEINCLSRQAINHASGIAAQSFDVFRDLAGFQFTTGSENEKLARRTRLQVDLDSAKTFREKRHAYRELYLLDFDQDLEAERRASLFDAELVQRRLNDLEAARNANDLPRMLHLVRTQLTRDLGWMCNPALHNPEGVETEVTIDRYQKAVLDTVAAIVAACRRNDPRLDKSYAREELKNTLRSFGRVALLCSGGGTMGMNHIGVIKTLYEIGRLPRVVSGSSAGAIVCAVLCSRTDSELPQVLEEFCHGDLAVFVSGDEKRGLIARLQDWFKNGYFFDSQNLERVMRKHLGNMTFQEAYSRTGRILNITVSNADSRYQSHRVLNFLNAGDVVIWSAVVASCAIPWGFKPAKLLSKHPVSKDLVVFDETEYIDGSIDGDIPLLKMSQQFGCNYFIVAQANPHVLAGFRLKEAVGFGLCPRAFESLIFSAMDEVVNVLLPCGDLARRLAGLFDQPYSGDVTIRPELTLGGLWNILSNPTPEFMDKSKKIGEDATYPFLSMIKNHIKIERALDQAHKELTAACHFSDSQSDLRRLQMQQNARSYDVRGRKRAGHGSMKINKVDQSVYLGIQNRNEKLCKASDGHGKSSTWDSREHGASFSFATDDESDDEVKEDSVTSVTPPSEENDSDSDCDPELEAFISRSYSAPTSPRPTTAKFFDSPTGTRSRSPVAPVSLMMTPAKERPVLPTMKRRDRCDNPLQRRASKCEHGDVQPPHTVDQHSLMSRTSPSFQLELPQSTRQKRSSSTGHLGVRQ